MKILSGSYQRHILSFSSLIIQLLLVLLMSLHIFQINLFFYLDIQIWFINSIDTEIWKCETFFYAKNFSITCFDEKKLVVLKYIHKKIFQE